MLLRLMEASCIIRGGMNKSGFIFLALLPFLPANAAKFGTETTAAKVETWRMAEISFTATKDYGTGGGDAVRLDVAFSNRNDGTVILRPGFWDGGKTFLARFAPPSAGTWDWRSHCPDDPSLSGKKGRLECIPYAGRHEIYRRGFVKSVPGKKYLVYADGTPFFYLGDTHWSMFREELDEAGPHADGIETGSHFKYIVDHRANLGFTVYQSESINPCFDLTDGKVDASDIPGFRKADAYFQYIADKGLVHANAQFFFPSRLTEKLGRDRIALERLSRYWVARFGAWPVMWTLAQEIDDDFYSEKKKKCNFYGAADNPWYDVARFLRAADAYRHPLSGHQESTDHTTVSNSIFASAKAREETGHDWWAAQWSPALACRGKMEPARLYWRDSRPAVNYEGRYCGLWTLDSGARAQGYISFLSGFCGYGYGAADIWLYKGDYELHDCAEDGIERITPGHKRVPWGQAVNFPSARQMRHMRRFFESFDWWRMTPMLDGNQRDFVPYRNAWHGATINGAMRKFVFYFLSNSDTNRLTGALASARQDRSYVARWFDPVRGAWSKPDNLGRGGAAGLCHLPSKPDVGDWALVVDEMPAIDSFDVTVTNAAVERIDFGPDAAGGYAQFEVAGLDPSASNSVLRIAYAIHPDGLGPKGDFWRETAARYLGDDVDLPILPANIDRYELYKLDHVGTYRAKLLQGLVRYVRFSLDSANGVVAIRNFRLVNDKVHSDGERAGFFLCSDTKLAHLWEASVRTCELSAIPSYMATHVTPPVVTLPYLADGAKRDRLVWSGDLWFAERTCFYGFKPSAPYMRGSIDMLAANQTPEGYIQASPWPEQPPPKAGEWGPFGSDEFACWFVPVLQDYYLHTADIETARRHYPKIVKLMSYLAAYQRPDGIFEQRKETCKHAAGLVFGDTSLHHRSYMNVLLWKTYVDAAYLADAVGEADGAKWRSAADTLAKSIRKSFWKDGRDARPARPRSCGTHDPADRGEGFFALSEEDATMGFEANALALATRFATADEAARIMPQLKRTGHGKFQQLAARGKFEYGDVHGGLKALEDHNWYKLLEPWPDGPDWPGVRLTSECMSFHRKGWGDEAHPDTCVASLYTNYILGITPTKPGYAEFSFSIPDTARLEWAQGRIPTPHGEIFASWRKDGDGYAVRLDVPEGTKCRLVPPGGQATLLGAGRFESRIGRR